MKSRTTPKLFVSECGQRTRITRAGYTVAAVLCALVTAPGCHEFHETDGLGLPADGEELPILRQFAGAHSHESRQMQFVVRDEAAMARVLLRDVPIDFETEMLLVVTLGRRSSDQYLPSIERVWRDGGVIRVEISVRQPARDAPVEFASPYCMAIVPKCALNVADFDPDPPFRQRSWEQSPPPTDGL